MSSAEWVSIAIASAALLVSIGFGLLQNRKSERSAVAAERSVVAAERSAVAAEQSAATSDSSSSSSDRSAAASETSAAAAAQSAAEAAELRRIEADRDHDDRFRPKLGDELQVEIEEDGRYWLKGSLTFPRAYRVKAIGMLGENSSTTLNLYGVVQPGRPYEFHVADCGNDGSFSVKEVVLHLWPPAVSDDVELWTCRCGRSLDDSGKSGHWQIRMKVILPPAMQRPWVV